MWDGDRLREFAPSELGSLVVVAVGFSVLGAAFFGLTQRRARRLGVMGHH